MTAAWNRKGVGWMRRISLKAGLMATIVIALIPIVIFYFMCQKYIIEGIVAGAVKG